MTLYTGRAFNATNGATGHTINGGAGSVHAALNDSNNATSVTLAPASAGRVRCGISNTPLSDGQTPTELYLDLRLTSDANYPANVLKITFLSGASSLTTGVQVGPTLYQGVPVSAVNYNYGLTVALDQYPELKAALPYLTIELALAINYGGNITLVNVNPSIGYISLPSTFGAYIASYLTNTTLATDHYRPTFTWDYTDSDGDLQAAYQLVLTSVNANGSSFDPYDGSYTIIEDSGTVYSSSDLYTAQTDLTWAVNPFSIWIRVASKSGTSYLWSRWEKLTYTYIFNSGGSNWGLEHSTMTPPEITTAVDDANGKVTLTINNVTNLLPEAGSSAGSNGTYWVSDPSRASSVTAPGTGVQIQKTSAGTGDSAAKSHSSTSVLNAKGYYPVLASKSYKFQATVDPNGVSKTFQFEVTWYDATGTIIGSIATSSVTTGTSSAVQSANFTAPSTARFATLGMAMISVPQNAQVSCSNIYFGLNVGTIIAPSCGSNGLNKMNLVDADIPTGGSHTWTNRTNANFTTADVTFTSPLGSTYLLVKGTATGFVSAANGVYIRCIPLTSYIFSFWAGLVNSGNITGDVEFGIEWYSVWGGSVIGTSNFKIISNTTVTKTITSPEDANYCKLYMKFTTTNTNAGVAIDQLYLALANSEPYTSDNIVRLFERGVGRYATGSATAESQCAGGTIVQIQRGTTASGPWTDVIGTNSLYSYWNQKVINDYAVAPTAVYYYRARTIVQDSLREIVSAWTVTSSVTMGVVPSPNTGKWVLKDPSAGTRLILDVLDEGNGFTYMVEEDQARFNPLGRNRVVVVRDVIRGARINLTADFLSSADFNTFVTLRALQKTLLLQKYDGSQWFISIDSDAAIEEQNTTPVRRFVRLSATEVNVPTV